MTEKSVGVDREDARLMPRVSTASSTAPVTGAGRELDALVAEKVMGQGDAKYDHTVPLYSTAIADAWLVVAALERKGYQVVINHFHETPLCRWAYHVSDEAEAAPLAICLAALKAVGG